MTRRPRTRGMTLLTLSAVAGLALVACGSDDDDAASSTAPAAAEPATTEPTATEPAATDPAAADTATTESDTTEPATTEPAATQPAELHPVRFAQFGHFASTLPWDVALEFDFFTKNGVDLQVLERNFTGPELANVMRTGEADMAYAGIIAMFPAYAAGADIAVVGTVMNGVPLNIYLNNDVMAEIEATGVTVDSPIQDKLNAMKGLNIGGGVVGNVNDTVFRFVLSTYGLNADQDLALRYLPPDPSALIAATEAGDIDGMVFTAGGAGELAKSRGLVEKWISFADEVDALSAFPYQNLVVTRSFLEENPEAVGGMVAAFRDARDAIDAGLDPADMASIKSKVAPDMDQALWDDSIELLTPRYTGPTEVSESGFETALQIYNDSADQPVEVTFDQLIDNSLVEG